MQNKNDVYFLSVKQAETIAAKHEADDWDIWTDAESNSIGHQQLLSLANRIVDLVFGGKAS